MPDPCARVSDAVAALTAEGRVHDAQLIGVLEGILTVLGAIREDVTAIRAQVVPDYAAIFAMHQRPSAALTPQPTEGT